MKKERSNSEENPRPRSRSVSFDKEYEDGRHSHKFLEAQRQGKEYPGIKKYETQEEIDAFLAEGIYSLEEAQKNAQNFTKNQSKENLEELIFQNRKTHFSEEDIRKYQVEDDKIKWSDRREAKEGEEVISLGDRKLSSARIIYKPTPTEETPANTPTKSKAPKTSIFSRFCCCFGKKQTTKDQDSNQL